MSRAEPNLQPEDKPNQLQFRLGGVKLIYNALARHMPLVFHYYISFQQ